MKKTVERERSQACLSFAERKPLRASLKRMFARVTMTLALMVFTARMLGATNEYVSYIDGNGNSQNVNATVVTTDMGGDDNAKFVGDYPWLYVKNSVTLDGGYNNGNGGGTINIILGDGATLTVNGRLRFSAASVNINIYCQSGGTGKLVVNGSSYSGGTFQIPSINQETLTIYGGTVEVTNNAKNGYAFSGSSLVMNGGTATFNAPTSSDCYGIYANVAFNGGNLTATGWRGVEGNATLNHKATTDRISCSSYVGSVTIADGKYFKDSSGKVYAGTLTNDEKTSIASQTLQPATQSEYTFYCLIKNFSGTGTALDPYVISTTDAWDAFCNALDGDDTWSYFCDKSWKLGKNITVSRMAGSGNGSDLTTSDRPFCGTFDGGGNTLTFNYGSSGSPADENNLAPFRYVNNATIEHLHVTGDIYTKHVHAGGIVGMAYGTTNITDCHSSVNIHSSINGDGTHGGIMSCSWTGSTTKIEGCLFDGSIQSASGYATDQCGGFVGWRNATINVRNSLLTADLSTIGAATGDYPSATFVRNGEANSITNSYYDTALGTAQGKQRHSITAGEYVTVAPAGTATPYSTTGITAYESGIQYGDVLYAGNGDAVSLTLSHSNITGSTFTGYIVDYGSLGGNDTDGYTLTMPDNDATINAEYCTIPTSLTLVDNSITAHGATLNWTGNSDSYIVMVGKADEPTPFQTIDFATGDFSQGNFSFTTDYPFEVYSGVARSTNYHKGNSTSDMVLQVTIPTAGTLQFRAAVSSQSGIDKAYFSIDGKIQINGISGNGSANTYNYNLTAGTHTLCWYYTKNGSVNDHKDRFYVYNIIIKVPVPSSWDEYTANTTSITLNDLDPSTLYMAKVIGKSGSNGQSEPSDAIYFTTDNLPLQLADNDSEKPDGEKNTDLINAYAGKPANVTLADRTLWKDGAWNTLCLPFDVTIAGSVLDGDDVDVRTLSSANLENGILTLNFTNEGEVKKIEAGKPYIIKWTTTESPVDDLVNPVFTGVTIKSDIIPFETSYVDFVGITSPTNIYSADKTNLYLGANNTLYYPWGDNMTSFNLNAFRAYFQLKVSNPQAAIRNFVLNFGEGDASGITTTDFTDYTDRAGAWYTLDGRKLDGKPSVKGIYIHGGKKVVIQ